MQRVFHYNLHENFTLCSLDKHKPPLTSLRSTDRTISTSLTEQGLWTHDNQSSSQSILTDRKNWQGAYRDIIHLRDMGVCRLEIWTIRVGVQYSALVLGQGWIWVSLVKRTSQERCNKTENVQCISFDVINIEDWLQVAGQWLWNDTRLAIID